MPELFYPKKWIDSPYNIPWEDWYSRGLRGVIFDIDNTLVEDNAPANEKARGLFLRLKGIGITPFLLSNNDKERVAPFAKAVGGCAYICKAGKPGPKGYERALKIMKTGRSNTISVGDQIFTDTVGANQAGIYSILVNPVAKKEVPQVRLKRIPEKPILFFYKRHHDWPGKVRKTSSASGESKRHHKGQGR